MSETTPRPHRTRRIVLWVLGIVIGLPVGLAALAIAVLLIGANTGPGRRLIEGEAASLTGGTVHLAGLSGRFPDRLHLARIELHDPQGAWLAIDGLTLDWSPTALLRRVVSVDTLSATRIDVARLPVSAPAKAPQPAATTSSGGPNIGIALAHLAIGTLHVGPALLGAAAPHGADLGIDGHADLASLAPIFAGISVASLPDADIALTVSRRDAPGGIGLTALVTRPRLALHLSASDPQDGLIAALAHLPAVDPLNLKLDLDGPRTAATLGLALTAGPEATRLQASAQGNVDLIKLAGQVAIRADAPAMSPVPGVSWRSLHLDLTTNGPFARPDATGKVAIAGLAAGGATIDTIDADLGSQAAGDTLAGLVKLHATLAGVRLPGPKPDLLATSPILIDAAAHLDQPRRPVTLSIAHPLLQLTAQANTADAPAPDSAIDGTATLTLPDLAPLAAAGGTQLAGSATFNTTYAIASDPHTGSRNTIGLDGKLALTGGMPQAVALIGDKGHLTAQIEQSSPAAIPGQPVPQSTIAVHSLVLDGQALHLDVSGTDAASVLDLSAHTVLPKLAALVPSLRGAFDATAHVTGPTSDLTAHLDATTDPGTATLPQGKLHAVIDAQHLPGRPQAQIALDGDVDRAPLHLAANVEKQASGAMHVLLSALSWKSAKGNADLTLPPNAAVPLGTLDLSMARLADLATLIGQPVTGSLDAKVRTQQNGATPRVLLDIRAANAGIPTAHFARLTVGGHVDNPAGDPNIDLALDAAGIDAGSVGGSAKVKLRGTRAALALDAQAALTGAVANSAGPGTLDAALVLDADDHRVTLNRLRAGVKDEVLALTAPARVTFGAATAVDRLRLSLAPAAGGAAPALIDIAGRIAPTLALDATLSNVTPALAKPFAPTLNAAGVIAARAHLSGTTAKPAGTVHLTATNMHMASGPAAAMPPANLVADINLAGTLARLRSQLTAGHDVDLRADGTVPLPSAGPNGALALRLTGPVDLALANPIVEQQGRHVEGRIALDLGVAGTLAHPVVTGTVRLSGGGVADYAQGVRLSDIAALIEAQGQSIRLSNFSAKAGDGTITAGGTVGVLAPGLPVDLHIGARNARPLSSDLLTAALDMDISVRGQAQGTMNVGGTVKIDSASINIPNSLPTSVAQLHVIRPGQKPPPATTATSGNSTINLALVVNAPGQIFIRGHGLDAELGGKLTVDGTSSAPKLGGGFELRRGTFDLAGTRLDFTKGAVSFNGSGVTGRLDPSLDFTAESQVGSTTARLNVGGYASAPKITLSSSPTLPQDQVLALLLFGDTNGKISAVQAAQLAAALAELSGVGGGGGGVLNTVRSSLGLDRLSVGSGNNGNGASVEAGRYITKRVYVGAKQATSGGGTQAQVQVDLTKRLKLTTQVGTGGTVTGAITPENDPGDSVGLKYEFNY